MTTIHTFEDILAVMDRDPELRDAMHRHVLGEEILQLPAAVRQVQDAVVNLTERQAEFSATTRSAIEATANTLAQFMEQTSLLMTNSGERQAAIENDITELREGQVRLAAAVEELRERVNRLESITNQILDDVTELKAGMARANERLDGLETGQSELRAGQAELKAGQTSMQGEINRLRGTDYERKIVRQLRRSAQRRFGLRNAAVLYCITVPDNTSIPDLLDAALQSGNITEDEANDAELTDIIIGGNDASANPAYVVIEASVTIDRHDVDRAADRAAVISKATGASATAAVAGTAISEIDRQHADANSVMVIILPD